MAEAARVAIGRAEQPNSDQLNRAVQRARAVTTSVSELLRDLESDAALSQGRRKAPPGCIGAILSCLPGQPAAPPPPPPHNTWSSGGR
eukprot:tig00020544_g10487.t1